MYGVGHILRGCAAPVLTALLIGTPAPNANADTPNLEIADPRQALDFVDHLATDAFETLNNPSLSIAERDRRFRLLLDHGFNTCYMALMALGSYGRDLPASDLADYEARFDDFLLGKYVALIESYGVARFRTVQAERAGRRDVLVHMIVGRPGDALDTEWRVRIFDGEPRIIDVSVEGLSLAQSQREAFSTLIRRYGLDGLMSVLESYSAGKRA